MRPREPMTEWTPCDARISWSVRHFAEKVREPTGIGTAARSKRARPANRLADMTTTLHAIWTDGRLHLWGTRVVPPDRESDLRGAASDSDSGENVHRDCVSHDELRVIVGDAWDPLLASGAVSSELNLRVPCRDGRIELPDESSPGAPHRRRMSAVMQPVTVAALAFDPPDAMDLLSTPSRRVGDPRCAASFLFWSRAADFAFQLLADQRFAPSVQRNGGNRFVGRWRVIAGDGTIAAALRRLAFAMPGACRSVIDYGPLHASEPVSMLENFLSTTVDAMVRRSLAGDELTNAILEIDAPNLPPQTRWLKSLVGDDPTLTGTAETRAALHQTVSHWIARLEPTPARACRLHLRLDPPESADDDRDDHSERRSAWTLRLLMRAESDPSLIVDADELPRDGDIRPRILPSPFDDAVRQLRQDAAAAARVFPPLEACAQPDGPTRIELSLQDAYAFLRDAVPLLELEGFGAALPDWWRAERPRIRMRMDLRSDDVDPTRVSAGMNLDAIVSFDWRLAIGDDDLSPDEIARLARAREPLVRLRGRWTEIQPAEIDAAVRFMRNSRGGRVRLFDALRQCYLADDPETGLPVVGLRGHGWVERLLSAANRPPVVERVPPPGGFHGSLRPYQQRGLEWLLFLSRLGLGACLADDMGLGKTVQLIALLLAERESNEPVGPTLLVVPMSLVGNWKRELERFAPSLRVLVHHGLDRRSGQAFIDEAARHDVVISTYALCHRDFEHLGAVAWHRIALDEAQNIKNPASKQSAAARSLRAVHRVALTGTPLENRLSELWSILNFLNPGYLGGAAEFRRRFAVPIEKHHDADRASRLRDLIRPFVLRRLKSDPGVEVDLPPKMEMKVFCNLTKEQASLYEAVVGEMLGQIDRTEGIQRRGIILATLTRLKQVCNHPAHFLGDGSRLPKRSGKCDRLVEMLDEVLAAGDRALVFTQYREMGGLLEKLLRDEFNRPILFLHGGTARTERDGIVERFQNAQSDASVLVLSLKAGGFGLNLTAANHVFHFDRWWNPAVEDQATDRAHRIGQTRAVQVHKFVCIGTLEERIDVLLSHKRSLAENIIGTGEDWITGLSTSALRDLFALSREAVGDE